MHISEINIYPVKSLKGIAMGEALVEDRGLQFDRRWMLVNENNGHITQREVPRMALVEIAVRDANLSASVNGMSIDIPMTPESGDVAAVADVTIWNDTVAARPYDDKTNTWFSDALNVKCRLVLLPGESKRPIDSKYAVAADNEVSLADGYPFLLIAEGSLADLNLRLETPVPMNRFRPNLVVAGTEAFAEDAWKRIRIGDVEFHVVKPCERCVLTTVDQSTGEKTGKEPLRTLSTYRNQNGKVLFGQNLIAESAGGHVRVGDAVEILEMK